MCELVCKIRSLKLKARFNASVWSEKISKQMEVFGYFPQIYPGMGNLLNIYAPMTLFLE